MTNRKIVELINIISVVRRTVVVGRRRYTSLQKDDCSCTRALQLNAIDDDDRDRQRVNDYTQKTKTSLLRLRFLYRNQPDVSVSSICAQVYASNAQTLSSIIKHFQNWILRLSKNRLYSQQIVILSCVSNLQLHYKNRFNFLIVINCWWRFCPRTRRRKRQKPIWNQIWNEKWRTNRNGAHVFVAGLILVTSSFSSGSCR